MSLETTSAGVIAIIALMALVTLATRVAGVALMERVRIRPGLERFINAMASSVLVAVIVPTAVDGDAGARLALVATGIVMLVTHRPMPAIAAGIAIASLSRWFLN